MEAPIPIAIVGIGCRFSGGANSPEKFWQVLASGESTWSTIPSERWNAAAFFDADPEQQGMHNTRGGHFVEHDVAAFDAGFWGIPPAECEAMDPQHRLQLEMVYEALENAGITRQKVEGTDTAVYIATFAEDYKAIQQKDINNVPRYNTIGIGTAIISNRISYQLNLRGPSVTLDTGCSGSLVAVHQACQSLRLGECGMALAGGVNLILNPDQTVTMSLMRCFTEEGRCYSFDDRGSGYGRGEGAAVVALKRLDDAIRDGDPIRAVIRNTGVNQDGKTNGIMLPNGDAQRDLIRSVYKEANLDPNDTPVVEAHGTGTAVGDPLEVGAIQQALREPGGAGPPLIIGSVKPNVGHLESASGIAGLIKGVLMLEHQKIPPTIGIESLKPNLKLNEFNMAIPCQLQEWPADTIRRLSLSNYGYGGTNAHLILESLSDVFQGISNGTCHLNGIGRLPNDTTDIPNGTNGLNNDSNSSSHVVFASRLSNGTHALTNCTNGIEELSKGVHPELRARTSKNPLIITLSAESEESVVKIASNVKNWASVQPESQEILENLAFTLVSRRSVMRHRIAFSARTLQDIVSALKVGASTEKPSLNPNLLFVFTGQGAQWYAMGRELMNTESPFRKSLLKSDHMLRAIGADWSLIEELSKGEGDSRINESEVAQSATCAIQIALVDLLAHIGIRPHTVVGHSSGEIAAAYAAEAVNHESALTVAWNRGACTQGSQTKKGAMLAVAMGEEQVGPYLDKVTNGKAVIACANSPSSTTVSGDSYAIAEVEAGLKLDGIFVRKLMVDRAYHSHHMQEAAGRYLGRIEHLKFRAPAQDVKFVSSVTGRAMTTQFTPQYWVDNLVSKVQFADAFRQALQSNNLPGAKSTAQLIVELGPHNALAGPIRQILKSVSMESKSQLFSGLLRGKDSTDTFASLATGLFLQGCSVELGTFNKIMRPDQQPQVLVSLPPYVWNHSTRYWHESRISIEHRFRKHRPHDLLGVQIPGLSSSRPVWRQILDTKRLPWLQEHVVNDEMIFPAAGYISMVLEALKQIHVDPVSSKKVQKYELRDIKFITPLIIPEHGSSEIQLQFVAEEASQWDEFRVYGKEDNGTVIEYCRGSATIVFATEIDEVEGNVDLALEEEQYLQRLKDVQSLPLSVVDTRSFYQELRAKGNSYGPHFACMKSMSLKGDQALSLLEVPDISECMPNGRMQPHLVHPAVLDSFLHPSIALANLDKNRGSVVTASIGHLTILSMIDSTAGVRFDACTRLTDQWSQICTADVDVFQNSIGDTPQPILHIRELRLQEIGIADTAQTAARRGIIYVQKWALDADFATSQDIDPYEEDTDAASVVQASKVVALNRIAAYFVNRTLRVLDDGSQKKVVSHYKRLVDWLRRFRETDEYLDIVKDVNLESSVEEVVRDTESLGVEGEVLVRVGQGMVSIITGEMEPLSLFTEEGLLWRLYADDASLRCYGHAIEYLRHLLFKNPNMAVLEIGAGTGGLTEPILQALATNTFPFASYDFTDISASFFEKSKERLSKWENNMRFRKLDLQEDLVDQGFQEGSYDLIMASNVLHVAHNIDGALTRIRKLLRPGGRILMIETTVTVPWLNFSIGVLPGWWAAEDGRINGPLISENVWDSKLKQNGLEGISVVGKDFGGPAHRCSMIVSKPIPFDDPQYASALPLEVVLPPSWDIKPPPMVQELIMSLKRQGRYVTTTPLQGLNPSSEKLYLVLDNGRFPVLAEKNDVSLFTSITGLVTSPVTLLWISLQSESSSINNPEKSLITGVLRTARTENRSLRAFSLNVQDALNELQSLDSFIHAVSELAMKMRLPDQAQPTMEFDSILKGGKMYIERVLPDEQLNRSVDMSLGEASLERQNFHQENRPLKLALQSARIIDKIRFEVDNFLQESVAPEQLEVRVEAFGINFKDVLIAGGHIKKKLSMAGEFAGTIVAVGAELLGTYSIGDRVCGFGATPYASRVRVRGDTIAKLPSNLSTTAGATIPVVYGTAYHSLVDVARLEKGQSILIHSAAGGVGQAAIAIAQWIGAEVFATVSNATKKEFLMKEFGIPANHIFSSRLRTFKMSIKRLTEGRGVDVVLNSLSGQILQDSLACVSRFGTFVEIGKNDIHMGSRLSLAPFDSSITLAAVDLSLIHKYKPAKSGKLIQKAVSLLSEGHLRLPNFQVRPLEELGAAFLSLQNRTHMGKIVLEAGADAMVDAQQIANSIPIVKDATYVVAGGRHGLGFELGKNLAKHGAKHIVLLSRRAVSTEEEKETFESFRSMQTNVRLLSCDISSGESIQASLLQCLETMPPVRGIIQSTMVAHYELLQNMTVEDYSVGTASKVDGTQNLLKALNSHPVDFCLMMSSLIGGTSGTTGQANYASANAYLAGLTQSSMHTQTRFVAICPGIIEDVGTLADDNSGMKLIQRQGCLNMQSKEIVALVDYALSEEAIQRKVNLITSGFNYHSFADCGRQDALDNPLFSHLPRDEAKREGDSSEKTGGNIHDLLANASSKSEADNIISQAIAKKVQTLVANEKDIDTSSTLGNLGIDSLTMVELKNWFVQTFQVRLQTHDVYDAPSIVHLASVVATRSPKLTFQSSPKPEKQSGASIPDPSTVSDETNNDSILPAQPLPDLDTSMSHWLIAVSAVFSGKEYKEAERLAKEFSAPGGLGRKLQARLAMLAHDPTIDNWQEELYTRHQYLMVRDPLVPQYNFAGTHFNTNLHSAAERAAVLASACHDFCCQLEEKSIKHQIKRGNKLEINQYKHLFNAVREPRKGEDVVIRYPGNHHLVAFRHGRAFKVDLDVSAGILKSHFQNIIDSPGGPESLVGFLTTDERDTWADTRQMLRDLSESNYQLLHTIETAEFVLYLDASSPETGRDRGRQFLYSGYNRWCDKTLQFSVCDNGWSATIGEHSMIDGEGIGRLNSFLQQAIDRHSTPELIQQVPSLSSHVFETNTELEQRIARAQSALKTRAARFDFSGFEMQAMNFDLFRNAKIPPFSGAQVVIQLACRNYFGFSPMAHETVGLSHFRKGRVDLAHTLWPAVKKFCDAASATTTSRHTLRDLFIDAARTHTVNLMRSTQGLGVDRHLICLEWSLREGEKMPEIFNSEIYKNSRPKMIVTDCLDVGVAEAHALPSSSEGIWIHYEFSGNKVLFSCWGAPERIDGFRECVQASAELVRDLLNE